jgi:hypothetical protein
MMEFAIHMYGYEYNKVSAGNFSWVPDWYLVGHLNSINYSKSPFFSFHA